MAKKWTLEHPDEDPIVRWVRGQTQFEVLVSPYRGDSEWWRMTLAELEEYAASSLGEGMHFTIPMVTGKESELTPTEVLRLAKKIRRKRW